MSLIAYRQLELVTAYAESMLRAAATEPGRAQPCVECRSVGSELSRILGQGATEPASAEQRAMLELALWGRRYSEEMGAERLAALMLGELVSLWLDQGKGREQFVGAMSAGWRSIVKARQAVGLDSSDCDNDRPL